MEMENVTNGMLYDLIRDFKDDVNRRFAEVDKRFEQVDRRFEQMTAEMNSRFEQITADMNSRFEQVHREMDEMKEMIKEDRKKLNEVYESRDRVTVTFSRTFVGINMVLSAMVSSFVSLLMGR